MLSTNNTAADFKEEIHPKKKIKATKDENDPPPPYGSKDYWEARYKKNKEGGDNGHDEKNTSLVKKQEERRRTTTEEEGLPYHSWYFSYKDLRPLILPLILGGNVDIDFAVEESNQDESINSKDDQKINDKEKDDEEEWTEVVQKEEEGQGIENDDELLATKNEKITEKLNENNSDCVADNANSTIIKENPEEIEEADDDEGDNNENDSDDEYFEEEEEIEMELDDDEVPERIGFARDNPASILEIGCGDVPLGNEIAAELISFQRVTKTAVEGIVKRIICCDYSSEVVNTMISQKMTPPINMTSDEVAIFDKILDFQTIDAREMSFKDESFELILEKGTLDAMLSDKKDGISNCQAIMAECSRVLSIDGYIFLVSHLNAHTSDGIDWLHQVVMPGLRRNNNNNNNITWEIEVHGNDIDEEGGGDDENPSGNNSPGPCVYIIQKKKSEETTETKTGNKNSTTEENNANEESGLCLRFFSY